MSEPIPSGRSRAAKIALAVVAGALGTALIGGGLWAAYDARKPKPQEQTEIEPAEETGEPTATPPAEEATGTGSSGSSASPGVDGTRPPRSGATRGKAPRPFIAYRSGGRLWVAREDGTQPVDVAPEATTYSLSPNGTQLAVIMDPPRSTGRVAIYEVATSGSVRMGGMGAYPGWLAWHPSGRDIAYSAGTLDNSAIRMVNPDGTGDRQLVSPGGKARFSPDRRLVAYRQASVPDVASQIRVMPIGGGTPTAVGSAKAALSFAFSLDGDLYFTRKGAGSTWEIWRSRAPYSKSVKVGSIEIKAPAFSLCDLSVSQDGRYLLTGARGDDHYCRVWVMNADTGKATAFQSRRDATPYGWTSDGRVLYFEGNTYQGESSSLMSARPDGTSRQVVVEGAAQ